MTEVIATKTDYVNGDNIDGTIIRGDATITGDLVVTGTVTSSGGGDGTVTSVSVVNANGVSGTVATATTTPAITLSLGAVTPSSVTVSGLTASQAVFTNGSKVLTSNAITGSGNVVMSASPTLTGTIVAANQTLSGTLGVTGKTTLSSGVAVMTTPTTQHALRIVADQTLAGTDQFCVVSDFTSSSSATDSGTSLLVAARIGDSFTQTETIAIRIAQGSKGAGSTITTNYAIKINTQISGATNYAIYSESGLVSFGDNLFLRSIKSGATQGGAGAAANEVWKTSGHATLPNNVLMIGV